MLLGDLRRELPTAQMTSRPPGNRGGSRSNGQMSHQGGPSRRDDPFGPFADQHPLHFPVQHHSAGGVVLAEESGDRRFLRTLTIAHPKHGALGNGRADQAESGGIEFQESARPHRTHRSLGEVVQHAPLIGQTHRETADHRGSVRQPNTRCQERADFRALPSIIHPILLGLDSRFATRSRRLSG